MLFNVKNRKPQTNINCLTCPYFDKKNKKCKGIGKACFEYDEKTKTIYDPITHLPIKPKE